MVARDESGAIPPWVQARFTGAAPRSAERVAWGFRNETWLVETADGRRLAITRAYDIERGISTQALMSELAPALAAAGVPVPSLVALEVPSAGILATEFVDGRVAAAVLSDPGGAVLVGRLMGTLWRRLGSVHPTGSRAAPSSVTPAVFTASAREHLARVHVALTDDERRWLEDGIGQLGDQLRRRPSGFVHGDFVPVNVLIRNGSVAALLDFESACYADPLLDAAWFRLIVGYHHPDLADRAWTAFAEASGLDVEEPTVDRVIRMLAALRILEILATDHLDRGEVGHWLRMLRAWLADRGES